MRLKDKVALITGGSRGIGRSIANLYAKEGAFVFIISRNKDELNSTILELSKYRHNPKAFCCDIRDAREVCNLYREISSSVARLDILVNNAAILGKRNRIIDYPKELWEDVINVNLSSLFYITKTMLPLMIKGGGGSIINLSSSVGRVGKGTWGAYAVSKFGVEGISQIIASEMKDYSIRSNTVNPGATRTKMRALAYPNEDPSSLVSPHEILDIFLYLAIDESKHISGSSFEAQDFSMNSLD